MGWEGESILYSLTYRGTRLTFTHKNSISKDSRFSKEAYGRSR